MNTTPKPGALLTDDSTVVVILRGCNAHKPVAAWTEKP